jgi:manganese-dependent inorganic pyrophosphatase
MEIPPHYIVGHKNPDTDSVVSAEVLAWLYESTNYKATIPIRLGALNPQSSWLFEQANRTPPTLRTSCRYHAIEIAKPVPMVTADSSLRQALETMQRANSDFVVVVNEMNQPLGIVSDRSQHTNYLLQCNIEDFIGTLLNFPHIISGLPLTPLWEGETPEVQHLEVPLHKHSILGSWDSKTAIVIGDRDLLLNSIITNPPAAVIITNVTSERAIEIAAKLPCPCYHYRGSLISMMGRLPGCFPVTEALIEEFTAIDTQMREDQIECELKKSQWGLVVLDINGTVVGSISARDIIMLKRPKLSLVDHSERGQAIDGLSSAEIFEIIDHHRLGDIETIQPLNIDVRPLGSTASILFDRINEAAIEIPPSIAILLLGALLADTLLLTSPTCVESDQQRAQKLAELAGVELQEFGIQVLRKNDQLLSASATELVNRDCKPFTFEDVFFLVAQIETVDIKSLSNERTEELKQAFIERVKQSRAAFGVLMITDVLASCSQVMIIEEGDQWAKIHLPDSIQANGEYWVLDKFVSRKKQLIPLLLNNIKESQQ